MLGEIMRTRHERFNDFATPKLPEAWFSRIDRTLKHRHRRERCSAVFFIDVSIIDSLCLP